VAPSFGVEVTPINVRDLLNDILKAMTEEARL
jgi:hypothetical protein